MAQAVADSAAMVLCLCSPYNTSIHCIKEVISGYDHRLPLLPVVMEREYKPLDLLRFVLTGSPSIELYNETQVNTVADSLTNQLQRYGAMRRKMTPLSAPPPTDSRKLLHPTSIQPPPTFKLGSPLRGHQRSKSDCGAAVTAGDFTLTIPTNGKSPNFTCAQA